MRQRLQDYLNRKAITANRLSGLAKVRQSTISRFLTGRTKTVTPAISRVLAYAGIEDEERIHRISEGVKNPRLRAALERNWDGTDEGAEKLAALIDAVGPMLRSVRLDPARERSK